MGINKSDTRWNELLTIWWGDLKTGVQMLGMQSNRYGMNLAYNQYQYIFSRLIL